VIDISDLDRAAVLATLYNAAKPQGLGFMHYDPSPMTLEEAQGLLPLKRFDYLKGRVLRVDLSGDQIHPAGYDRDNGPGAARRAIDSLRRTCDPNSSGVRDTHVAAARSSLDGVRAAIRQHPQVSEQADTFELDLGLVDMRDHLVPLLERPQAVRRRW
jgi:hypothetical protein